MNHYHIRLERVLDFYECLVLAPSLGYAESYAEREVERYECFRFDVSLARQEQIDDHYKNGSQTMIVNDP